MGTASMSFGAIYRVRGVPAPGHTGFKGAWLSEWLIQLGAEVTGFSIGIPTTPSLFEQIKLASRLRDIRGDIRDPVAIAAAVDATRPDFVFHLAAQPLVRLSYEIPVETWQTNVMGTIHMIEALRNISHPCAAVMVTTDKCYENREWLHGYRENDPLGGHDPYSSSKAACEIAIAAWQKSFLANHPLKMASARAGNVIGGGDWALDRIIPDSIRALASGNPITVRNPAATRPWQHVLEPLSGYLWLAACLAAPHLSSRGADLRTPFNFGPGTEANRNVGELVAALLKTWPGTWSDGSTPGALHEASLLHLSTDKAHSLLRWRPVWCFDETVAKTAAWYRQAHGGADAYALTHGDIAAYTAAATAARLAWAA
ncbi:CDP-glucose 4,6-dehydratase [Verrucomicrobiota bacterium]|nr:CDP-glucose 4,6-dehydratase [Verrucomicrobiota bacterium]